MSGNLIDLKLTN